MRSFVLVAVLSFATVSAYGQLRAGVSAIAITPFGQHADWSGPVSESGVWGDAEHRIWLAGFGSNRPATGKHDDVWARALVLESGKTKVALVALDFIGYPHDGGYFGADQVKKMLSPKLGLTEVIIASTHNHEGPDSIGLWAPMNKDGKYADYLKWVDRRIAEAITSAADPAKMEAVRAKFGVTNPERSPILKGLQVRTSHRPPQFYDEELRVMQLLRANGKVFATMVNWNTHPESMESKNQQITSDFPHFVRAEVEKKFGGTAVYFSGDIGAVEIEGDTESWTGLDYEDLGGKRFPLDKGHRPAALIFERTQAIGEAVAKAAIEAIEAGKEEKIDGMKLDSLPITAPVTNPGFIAMMKAGVLHDVSGDVEHPQVQTTLYHLRVGPADFITLPGEIFPELLWGVEAHKRTDCDAANTGRPYEPSAMSLLKGKYRFIIGLAPDEYGYVIPGYDFTTSPTGRVDDACKEKRVPNHYHETNSSSSQMAPAVACGLVKLLGGDPTAYAACK